MKKYLLAIFLLFLFAKMPAAAQNMDLRQPFCSGLSVSSNYLYPGDSIGMIVNGVSYATRVRFAMTPKSNPQCQGGNLTHDFGLAGSVYSNTSNISFSSSIPGSISFYGKYTVFANPAIVAGEDNVANRTDFPYSWISTSNPKAKSHAVWCSNVSSDKTCDAQYCWAGTPPGGQLLCVGDQCDSEAEGRDLNVLSNNVSCTSDICVVSPSLCGVRECGKVTTDDGLCDIMR